MPRPTPKAIDGHADYLAFALSLCATGRSFL
jgi:hypothetical protein